MSNVLRNFLLVLSFPLFCSNVHAQNNWDWNEALLESIRNDVARPVVHARNLYHHSLGMYNIHDAIALNNDQQLTLPFDISSSAGPLDLELAWSGFSWAFLDARYSGAPGVANIEANALALISAMHGGASPASLAGNESWELGMAYAYDLDAHFLTDGSNQANNYANTCYTPVNPAVDAETPGACVTLVDPDHWQPLSFGVTGGGGSQDFLGANWGEVTPFAYDPSSATTVTRDGCTFTLYDDPGFPQYLSDGGTSPYSYINGFALVVAWQQDLQSGAGDETIDISPASQGNIGVYPDVPEIFYSMDGANLGSGHSFNPITQETYAPNPVLKSDFTRVLAEFWADGPNSETPPGHWFAMMNHDVFNHPMFVPAWRGEEVLSSEEWLSRAYLLLGGAMHDCAIAAWGVKGYYDFIRPISAIRHMQSLGQSTDATLSNYDPHGLPLIDGVIETIEAGDPLLSDPAVAEGDIKIMQWVPAATAGAAATFEWKPGCHWLPYQLPSFVTPPFAGYVSGHSTFSSAAAGVLEEITGSPYWPGGMGHFLIDTDFLNFDIGPSTEVDLQWATYKDAADQAGLSRIWGGIHPPVDDIRGRNIGFGVAENVINLGANLFESSTSTCDTDLNNDGLVSSGDILMVLADFGSTCP